MIPTSHFDVKVTNGGLLTCHGCFQGVPVIIQEIQFLLILYALNDPIFTHTLCVAAQRIGCSSTSALVGTIGTANVQLERAHHGVLLEEAIP